MLWLYRKVKRSVQTFCGRKRCGKGGRQDSGPGGGTISEEELPVHFFSDVPEGWI
jgi:hypothetical protein